ncbi:hypothetical protein BSKO_01982 [Bryopsis sp. KO-2023]|nr:hypothetical protein BSKO_01982 [Bryopsis sp. KO-2023]
MGAFLVLALVLSGHLGLGCASTLPNAVLVEDSSSTFRASTRSARALLQSSEAEASPEKTRFINSIYRGDVAGVRKAVAEGVDLDAPIQAGQAALHVATSNGNAEMVAVLLDLGADANQRAPKESSALHIASMQGDATIVGLLLLNGADVDIQDAKGFAPLHFSAYGDMSEDYNREELPWVDGAFEVKKRISGDRLIVPSESAVANFKNRKVPNHIGVLSLLLANGADVDATTKIGESPLHYVSSFDRYQAAIMLIRAGANIEIADVQGERPLHEAVAYGARGVAQVLLKAGADTYVKEENGMNAREFICRCRTYDGNASLTPCGPGKCISTFDKLVLESMIDAVRHS